MIVTRGILLALTAASMATPSPTSTSKTCAATGACANLRLASCETLNVTKSITLLDLSSNELKHLNSTCLPTSTNLDKLNLSRNNLKTLDANTFLNQPGLDRVDLSHNYIRSVPQLTFNSTNLTSLNLANNHLTSIPSLKADSLRRLDLRNNRITSVTNLTTFASMRRLEALYLTGNSIEAIDADVFKVIPNVSLRICKSDVTATLEGDVSNLILVECSTVTSTSPHHLLFLIGITTLVSCVCAMLVIAAIYLVVTVPRRRPPGGVEMHALTPTTTETFDFQPPVQPPRRVFRPHNDGYEIPLAGNEVDRLPMAPATPVQNVPVEVHMAENSAGLELPNHTYLKMLGDADEAPLCAAPQPAVRRSLLREFSSRELPPIPIVQLEQPAGLPQSNIAKKAKTVNTANTESKENTEDKADTADTVEDGRNSFSDFVESRASSTRETAPPVPPRPDWVIK